MQLTETQITQLLAALQSEDPRVRGVGVNTLRARFGEIFLLGLQAEKSANSAAKALQVRPKTIVQHAFLKFLLLDVLLFPFVAEYLVTRYPSDQAHLLAAAGAVTVIAVEAGITFLLLRSVMAKRPQLEESLAIARRHLELFRAASEIVEDPEHLWLVMNQITLKLAGGEPELRPPGDPVWTAIIRLLPRTTGFHAHLINETYRQPILKLIGTGAAKFYRGELAAVFDAIGRLGDRRYLNPIRAAANSSAFAVDELKIQVNRTLKAMEDRFAQEDAARTMLRPSEAPSAETLLRPGSSAAAEQAYLLHPAAEIKTIPADLQ